MALITFTQYMLPHGNRKSVSIDRPAEISDLADKIRQAGFWFECEVLTTGDVSLTITDDEMDHDIEVCPNGPDVPVRVDAMIKRFASKLDQNQESA